MKVCLVIAVVMIITGKIIIVGCNNYAQKLVLIPINVVNVTLKENSAYSMKTSKD